MSAALLSTFTVDGHLFGVEVTVVQEVIRYQPMTRVPLAPAALAGLINLRGQVITAVDLRRRLGFCDRIGEVVEVDDEAFEEPPETLEGIGRELIRGAYQLDHALLLRLDVQGAVELPPRAGGSGIVAATPM